MKCDVNWCNALRTQNSRWCAVHQDEYEQQGPDLQRSEGPLPLDICFNIMKTATHSMGSGRYHDPFAAAGASLPPPPLTTADKIKGAMGSASGALGRGLHAAGRGILDAGGAALSGSKKLGENIDSGAEALVGAAHSAGTNLPNAPAMPGAGIASHINQGQGMGPIHRVLGTGEYGPEGSARDPLAPNYERRIGLTGVVSNTANRLNPFGGGHKLRASKTNVQDAHVSQGKNVPAWLKNRQVINYVDRAQAAGLPIDQYEYTPPAPTGGNP